MIVNKLEIADNKIAVIFFLLTKFKIEIALRKSQPKTKKTYDYRLLFSNSQSKVNSRQDYHSLYIQLQFHKC